MKKYYLLVCLLSALSILLSSCKSEQEKMDEVQKTALIQGLKTIILFKSQMSAYYAENQICSQNAISNVDRALTKVHYVKDVIATDECQIILTFKKDISIPDISRQQIILTMLPSASSHKWTCESTTRRKDLLPPECR